MRRKEWPKPMPNWQVFDLTNLDHLQITDPKAEIVTWQGRPALRLEGGFALLKDLQVTDAVIELDLGADPGGCYPGLAFRGADSQNIELIYCQPHTSGQWDALQYDPVLNGSNTWQIFHGPGCQATAQVPAGQWLTLRVELSGQSAMATLGGSPLHIPRLAHDRTSGAVGVWTYRPAYFSQLRIGPPAEAGPAQERRAPEGTITEWWLEGYGPIKAEPNGTVCLNRYRPISAETAVLKHTFTVTGDTTLHFGFSDELRLLIDDTEVFTGSNRFTGFASRESRGYIDPDAHHLPLRLLPGEHTLTAHLSVSEPFGWGLSVGFTR